MRKGSIGVTIVVDLALAVMKEIMLKLMTIVVEVASIRMIVNIIDEADIISHATVAGEDAVHLQSLAMTKDETIEKKTMVGSQDGVADLANETTIPYLKLYLESK